jgi:hypothetical protein
VLAVLEYIHFSCTKADALLQNNSCRHAYQHGIMGGHIDHPAGEGHEVNGVAHRVARSLGQEKRVAQWRGMG